MSAFSAACYQWNALGLKGTGGSDSHYAMGLGAITMFEREIKDEADLAAALREGNYKAAITAARRPS